MNTIPVERADIARELSSASDVGVTPGHSSPLGATVLPGRVNFSVYSRNASRAELLLFEEVDDAFPRRVIPLDAATHRTDNYWHVCVHNVKPGQIYGYRVCGPSDPSTGMR